MKNQKSIPLIAPVIKISPSPSFPGALLVLVRCPFCGEGHEHGVPEGQAISGLHRSEHCSKQTERPGMRRKTRERLARTVELRAHYNGYIIQEDGTV